MTTMSPEEFAKSSTRTIGGIACQTCSNVEVAEAIRKILHVWKNPKSGTPSLAALHHYLVGAPYKYPLGVHALRKHVAGHEQELWAEVRTARAL